MRVIIACEESQEVCKAFRERGHEAFSCDLKAASGGFPEWHLQGSIFDFLNDDWDLMIAHPPCTYLTVTANKWLKDQAPRKSGALIGADRRQAQKEAIDFFMALASVNIPYAIENPVGIMSTGWRNPDQIIQPMDFGHAEPKKTCLWLQGLPKLIPTHRGKRRVKPEYHTTQSGKRLAKWYYFADKSQGQAERATIRSKTFPGIAAAMAEQWGTLPKNLFS